VGVSGADEIFAPPVQRALRAPVYEALRRAIAEGVLRAGQRVNEAEIARQMQISRAPVREAIRQLEQEGLLVSVPRRGTVVVTLSRADVEEVYTLRADLESRAVRRAISRLSPEDFQRLQELVDAMESAGASDDQAALLEADIAFHRTIVTAAGWPHLRRIWESLHPQTLTLYTLRTVSDWSPRRHAERHVPVLQALRAGDADAAAETIRHHIQEVGVEVMRRLDDDARLARV
jgi:DNA-binding GntR family transcriptional regulator